MDYGHPLQFGALITPASDDPQAPVERARLAERLGFDLAMVTGQPGGSRLLDPWTVLGWVVGHTERIRLSATVQMPAQPVAVLARAAASLDLLAGGRIALALAADAATEGETAGLLGEAIEVIRGVWDAADRTPLHYHGAHNRLDGAERGPAPAHTIPLWVEGTEPGLLWLAGRQGDGWVSPVARLRGADLRAAQAVIDEAAADAGRDPREIRRLASISGRFARSGEGFLAGPSQQWVDELLPLVLEDGIASFVLAAASPAVMRQFAAEVAPALREAVAGERAARGTAEGTVPSLLIRSRRRPGIDYDHTPPSLAGAAIEPGDAGYARVRATFFRGGSPGLVLQPRTTPEVADALTFARSQPTELSIRSGGHGLSGRSTNDGGIVIDLARLNAIDVLDQVTRRVRIGPGARWGQVAAALQPRGWAITSGDTGSVGVGGLATAGGIGWLVREHGLTIDHLRAVEMVLADGTIVRASDTENEDLFWAVRGAGANFGIVTSLEFEADQVGEVAFGQLILDASDIAGFLQRWGAAVEAAPRDLTSFLIMGPPRGGQPVIAQVLAVVDSRDPDTIVERITPLAASGDLQDYTIQVLPYPAVLYEPGYSHEAQGEPVARSALVEHITPGFAAAAERLIRSGETYFFQIRSAGGAVADVDPGATAYAHRSANFSVVAFGASPARLDRIWDGMREHFSGMYLSFETDPRPERLHDAFPPATLERLRALKRRYDPDNVFRDNFNITPQDAGPRVRT